MNRFSLLICIFLCFTSNTFAADPPDVKNIRDSGPSSLWIAVPAISWMVYEGGRNPQFARNYYATAVLASMDDLDSRVGKAALAITTVMAATNHYYVKNPAESTSETRLTNLVVFGVTAMAVLGINAVHRKMTDEQRKVGLSVIGDNSYGIVFNYRF